MVAQEGLQTIIKGGGRGNYAFLELGVGKETEEHVLFCAVAQAKELSWL